jgi:hypothetical protein
MKTKAICNKCPRFKENPRSTVFWFCAGTNVTQEEKDLFTADEWYEATKYQSDEKWLTEKSFRFYGNQWYKVSSSYSLPDNCSYHLEHILENN